MADVRAEALIVQDVQGVQRIGTGVTCAISSDPAGREIRAGPAGNSPLEDNLCLMAPSYRRQLVGPPWHSSSRNSAKHACPSDIDSQLDSR
jgi:hypothetical protein